MNKFETEQEQFWVGDFGEEYTDRNQDQEWISNNIALFSEVEYYSPQLVEVSDRGHQGKLFKCDFAGAMLDKLENLQLVNYGFVDYRDRRFPQNDITWFLLEKTGGN